MQHKTRAKKEFLKGEGDREGRGGYLEREKEKRRRGRREVSQRRNIYVQSPKKLVMCDC